MCIPSVSFVIISLISLLLLLLTSIFSFSRIPFFCLAFFRKKTKLQRSIAPSSVQMERTASTSSPTKTPIYYYYYSLLLSECCVCFVGFVAVVIAERWTLTMAAVSIASRELRESFWIHSNYVDVTVDVCAHHWSSWNAEMLLFCDKIKTFATSHQPISWIQIGLHRVRF